MDYRSKVQSPKSKVSHDRPRVFDFGFWILDFGFGALGRAGFFLLLCLLTTGCGWLPNFLQRSADKSVRLTDEARQACEKGDHEKARQLLIRAAAVAPDDPDIQYRIGRVLLIAGDTDEAVKHLRYATKRGVDDPDAYLELAHVLVDAHQYGEAQEMIDSALRLVPNHVPAQLMAARLAELRHKDDDALSIYYRVLANDPTDMHAMICATDVLMRTDRKSQAAPLLRTIVDSDRVSPVELARAHWNLGLIYGHDRRWTESAAQLAAAADLRPDLKPDETYQIAYACWEAGDREKAQDFVTRTLASNPKHADAQALSTALHQTDAAAQTAYSRPPLPAPKVWQ
jgi:tetratricopeptide (TPR) repeat protein